MDETPANTVLIATPGYMGTSVLPINKHCLSLPRKKKVRATAATIKLAECTMSGGAMDHDTVYVEGNSFIGVTSGLTTEDRYERFFVIKPTMTKLAQPSCGLRTLKVINVVKRAASVIQCWPCNMIKLLHHAMKRWRPVWGA